MTRYVCESYALLLKIEWQMTFHDFRSVHDLVRGRRIQLRRSHEVPSIGTLCYAMDLACVFSIKSIRCLQRSAATTLLLRKHGYRAEMILAANLMPFSYHAWVEIDGTVVNDKPYMVEIYKVLDRC
jgi:Transglutaminase-like superfamily